jgi:Flp pilus assembly protein TadG
MRFRLWKGIRSLALAGAKSSGSSSVPVRHSRIGRKGAVLVEFGIVLPVFILLILGIIEFGRAYMVLHLLTDAARKACRSAAVKGSSTSTITASTTSLLTSESVSGATLTVKVKEVVADASSANSGDEITVIVSVPASSVSFVGTFVSGNLTGQYSMLRE